MFSKVGLFVSVNGEKLTQRTIVTRAGTVAVPDTTIADVRDGYLARTVTREGALEVICA